MKIFSLNIKSYSVFLFFGSFDGVCFNSVCKTEKEQSYNQYTNIIVGKTFVKKHPKFNNNDISFFIFFPIKIGILKKNN